MRSKRKNRKNNIYSKAALCVLLGAYMAFTTGFTDTGANHVEITADGKTFSINTNAAAPQEIFAKANINLNENDEYVLDKDGNNMKLTVYRAVPITIEYNGESKTILSSRPTVGEALEDAGYYNEDYDASVDFSTALTKDMKISLTDSATFIARKQEEAAARERATMIETSRGATRYSEALYMEASAYLPSDGGGSGITASGIPASYGVAAVDPSVIPLGTRLFIPGYGEAIAADTGGAIIGNKIDLCMEDYGEAIQFGRRDVTVYVLEH